MPRFTLGELQPDQPDLLSNNLEQVVNAIPYEQSYGPFPDLTAYSNSISATCVGAYSTIDVGAGSKTIYTFAGTEKQIYRESAGAISNVSRTVTYNTGTEGRWEFVTYGRNVYAVNGADAMQFYTMGTSTTFRDMSASSSAPVATHIAAVRDFVMVGNLSGFRNRVQWCQIDNPTRWTVNKARQADWQDLPNSTEVCRILGGDFATIITENSIWSALYVGAPLIFRFTEVSPGIGCYAMGSAARFQGVTYFLANSGFQAFDGQQCIPIGEGRIDEELFADIDTNYLHKVSAVIDPFNKIYCMGYTSVDSPDGRCDKMILYGYAVDRWCFAEIEHETLFITLTATEGVSIDALGVLDDIVGSLDSYELSVGQQIMAAVNVNHRISRFNGAALDGVFVTGEQQFIPDQRSFITAIKPLIEGASGTTVSAAIGGRDRTIDPVTWSADSAMNGIGLCPVRANNRFQRVRINISGGWTRVSGFDLMLRQIGAR